MEITDGAASLLCEVDLGRVPGRVGTIIHHAGTARLLSLALLDDGTLHFVHRVGPVALVLDLSLTEEERAHSVRLTYVREFDGSARLVAEFPRPGRIRQRTGARAPQLVKDELESICRMDSGGLSPEWLAIGQGSHRIGLGNAVAAGTFIATPGGPRTARSLAAGDLVLTDTGPQPLLGVTRLRVPSLGSLRPIRLAAPCFGLDSDLFVLPTQRIVLSDPEVDYQTGHEAVLIEARYLLAGSSAEQGPELAETVWMGLTLPEASLVFAQGLALETPDPSRLLHCQAIGRSTVFGSLLGSTRPANKRLPEVKGAEAISLVLALARRNAPIAA